MTKFERMKQEMTLDGYLKKISDCNVNCEECFYGVKLKDCKGVACKDGHRMWLEQEEEYDR